jgi:hypothetical protein
MSYPKLLFFLCSRPTNHTKKTAEKETKKATHKKQRTAPHKKKKKDF